MEMTFINADGSYSISSNELKQYVDSNNLICLIKALRCVSNLGLKDSKDTIEGCLKNPNKFGAILNSFQKLSKRTKPQPVQLSQFLSSLKAALEHADKFHMNYIEATHSFLASVEAKGGLDYLAEYYERFIDSI